MKWIVIIFSLIALATFGWVRRSDYQKDKSGLRKSPGSFVVLELFTSEGCSSCPPADRILPQLAAEDPAVIPLSFHVDYWDRLGWKDPFSNSEFSDRQKEYGRHFKLESIYTPELVINGEYELVGSNKPSAEADIKTLLKDNASAKLTIEDVKKDNDKLSVRCQMEGNWQNSDLVAALVQKHAEVNVRTGENHGATLTHTNVVRAFLKQAAKEKISFEISIPHDLAGDNWQLIVYTQQKNDLKITGAAFYNP